jgi:diguanylate cyclase (GGDEF)-like protein/PAS domain S-box-containing protein
MGLNKPSIGDLKYQGQSRMRKIFLDEHPKRLDQAIHLVTSTPFFRTVDPVLLRAVFFKAWVFELGKAEYLIRENNKSDRMVYVLLKGEFDIFADQKFILRIDQPGNTIGEMAVISPNTPRSADVIAVRPSEVIAIESAFLDRDDTDSRRLASAFFRMFSNILAEKLRITTDRAKLYENAVLEKQEIDRYSKEITEVSKDLERELQDRLAQVKLYSQVVESNLDAIIIADTEGRLQSGNEAFLALFGYSQPEIGSLHLDTLFKRFVKDGSEYIHVFADGWKGEKTAFRKSHESFPALISVSPIRTKVSGGAEQTVFAIVVRDITVQKKHEAHILSTNEELKQTYQELENTLQALEKSNKIKDRFLSNMSTQLKTPLNSIINYTELIHKHMVKVGAEDRVIGMLDRILDDGRKMDKLVGNLLTMAELASDMDLSLNLVRFEDFIDELKRQTPNNDRITIAFDSDIGTIIADPNRLNKALTDIFDYFRREQGESIKLYVGCTRNKETSQIEIVIAGVDIRQREVQPNDELQETLSDGVEISLQKGELHLPLAKRIIDLHQGDMRVLNVDGTEVVRLALPFDPKTDRSSRIKVLLVDEHEWDRRILKGIIEKQFVLNEIYEFDTQIGALNAINALKPDLLVVDPFFAEPEWPHEVFLQKLLTGNQEKMSTLVISDRLKDLSIRVTITGLGITDFLFKPFTIEDAVFKINGIIDTKQRLHLLSDNIQKAEKSAATDGLTGLFNRKHFDEFIRDQFIKAELQNGSVSVIMIDVDNFKHYNDTNGHQLGDEVLKKVAQILKDGVRKSDLAARYGGEEFVIVLPGTAKKMAENIADKLRRYIEEAVFPKEETQPKGRLTASFGVASYPENGATPEIVLKGADHCLYLAKEAGRNKVVGAVGIIELDVA